MFDLSKEFTKFEEDCVRLNTEQKNQLTGYRDANVKRVKDGLTALGFALPNKIVNQGSYAIHTTVQHAANDYDIDIGLVFDKTELPSDAEAAKQRIQKAIIKVGGNFKETPSVRTNAVTVWYQDGHHVDLAVYRSATSGLGQAITEHASAQWIQQGPSDLTNWFDDKDRQLSPRQANGAKVKDNQMRRIVRLLKMFGRTRESWSFPGGLIISVLVAESYSPDPNRDDVAFYDTVLAIKNRLLGNTSVYHPLDSSRSLTAKEKHLNQVKLLSEKLNKFVQDLNPLLNLNCTKLQAIRAWREFFNHEYWSNLVASTEKAIKEGEAIAQARNTSGLFVASSGKVEVSPRGAGANIPVPKHNFYGSQKKKS